MLKALDTHISIDEEKEIEQALSSLCDPIDACNKDKEKIGFDKN